ncbi:p-hydroxycinnamoyl-CoA synthetase [Actinomadura craniellae]|uniref:p-hydroxycinnamoyl-CoA synthetase n=1 Tax=Actinomadura craniellae TaxID=2231787 RepID=A0A365HAK2_9ACTN|nr:long-chain fatty acid--CoA ligase [Actinomadura craniellae]RAY16111.1 p-hydroxycinnamoyl-CoA synthetase [Actinomadura craniellae]
MRDQGLGSWPARRARMAPERTALIFEGRATSYGDLAERVARLARALRGRGISPGDRVAYLGPNHPAFLETLFATAAAGAVFVPLNFRLAGPELEYILDDCGAEMLVYAPDQAPLVAGLDVRVRHLVSLAEDYEDLLTEGRPELLDETVGHDDVCMIMYTSGTTGVPKGAMLTHGNLTWNCVNVLLDIDLTRDEVTLVSAPMFHAAALGMTCLPTFIKGGAAVIMPSFSPDGAFDLIEKHRVTFMFGVPAMFAAMSQAPRWADADLSSVRILECGGAPVPGALIETYRERGLTFLQGYGMTEAAPGVLFLGPEAADRVGSAGKASFFTEARLVGPDGSPPPAGEPGEIQVRGPNVMKGYWKRPDATREVFAEGAWFRSGDAAYLDDEGFFYIYDRIKDMIISGGENIYPAEVERALAGDPAVAECAVIGVPDETWGEVGKAFVVPREGIALEPGRLLESLAGKLAKYKIPKYVEVVDALPRGGSGKVLKQHLRRS